MTQKDLVPQDMPKRNLRRVSSTPKNVSVTTKESTEEAEVAIPIPVVEVMTCFNQRSSKGRVVVNPPARMAPLKTHTTTDSWYFCTYCGRSYLDAEKYNIHVEEHKNEDSEDELLINIKSTKTDTSPSGSVSSSSHFVKCQICRADVSHPQERRKHMELYHPALKCGQCGASFTQKAYLNSHIKRCHNEANPFRCSECTCTFSSATGLRNHVYVYHDSRSLRFTHLNIMASRPASKSKPSPVKIQTGAKSPINKFRVKQANSTPAVSRIVSNITFRCKLCKKTFSQASKLRIHHRIHSGEKPYVCDLCGISFRLSGNLTSHRSTNHSKEHLYPCSECACSFRTLGGRTKHVRKHHE